MERIDIVNIDISDFMRAEAEREYEALKIKWGKKSHPTINKYGNQVRRDYIGSLAHQAVEHAFYNLNLPYYSTRKEMYQGGDSLDIQYEEDKIDVKGTEKEFNEKYFYNEQFLVFQHQLDNPKIELLTHFIFVTIDPDYQTARIYGAITLNDFLKESKEVNLMYKNKGIKAYQLTPFRKYVYRV